MEAQIRGAISPGDNAAISASSASVTQSNLAQSSPTQQYEQPLHARMINPEPAFVRPSSGSKPSATAAAPELSQLASSSQTNNFAAVDATRSQPRTRYSNVSIPALGDASLMGELPTTDPLSTLLQKHLPAHIRPTRDLSGAWHAQPSHLSASASPNPGTSPYPDPFYSEDSPRPSSSAAQHPYPYHPSQTTGIDAQTVFEAARTGSWRRIATLARSNIEAYGEQEKRRSYQRTQQQHSLVDLDLPASSVADNDMDIERVLQWWSVRLYALTRLRLFGMMRTELVSVCNILESTSSSTSIVSAAPPSQNQPMIADGGINSTTKVWDLDCIPFSIRVLRATEPKFRGDLRTCIQQYVDLIEWSRIHLKRLLRHRRQQATQLQRKEVQGQDQDAATAPHSSEIRVWKERIHRLNLALGFTLAEAKDYSSAMEILQDIIAKMVAAHEKQKRKDNEKKVTQEEQCQTISDLVSTILGISRVWIQAGSVPGARALIQQAADILQGNTESLSESVRRELGTQITQSQAIVDCMCGEYKASEESLSSLIHPDMNPAEWTLKEMMIQSNVGIMQFYQGKLESSIVELENLLEHHPSTVVNVEAFLFNLTTLLELRSDDSVNDKKRVLGIVGRWAAEPGVGAAGLKL